MKMEYKKWFPERKQESLNKKIAYMVKSGGGVELYKFHYFAKGDLVGLVNIRNKGTLIACQEWAKIYKYELRSGKELGNWTSTK